MPWTHYRPLFISIYMDWFLSKPHTHTHVTNRSTMEPKFSVYSIIFIVNFVKLNTKYEIHNYRGCKIFISFIVWNAVYRNILCWQLSMFLFYLFRWFLAPSARFLILIKCQIAFNMFSTRFIWSNKKKYI